MVTTVPEYEQIAAAAEHFTAIGVPPSYAARICPDPADARCLQTAMEALVQRKAAAVDQVTRLEARIAELEDRLRDHRHASPYETACERFQAASEDYRKAKAEAHRILTEAEAEYSAAEDGLRQFESAPGIPLPQYREGAQS